MSKPFASATKVLALTTSKVVTPSSLLLSYVPAALKISAAIGTVEFTGFEMMAMIACAQSTISGWNIATILLACL